MTLRTALPTIVLGAVLGAAAAGQAQQAGPEAPAIEPAAIDALESMVSYLQFLDRFEVRSDAVLDQVLDSGQKLQFECALHLRVRRPDRIWLEVASRRKTRQFFYEGDTVTIWDRAINTTLASPLSILPSVVDEAEERCSIVMPLAEFFQWDVGPSSRLAALQEAMYVGPTSIKGDPCDQFAFREPGVDWQVWIQRGDSPLPRKLVITATDVEARPQYIATIDWNLAPALNDEMFTFEPLAESNRVIVLEIVPQ